MMTTLWLVLLSTVSLGGMVASVLLWRGSARVLQDLQQRVQALSEQGAASRLRLDRLEVEMRAVLERTRQVAPPPATAPLGADLAPRLAAAGASTDELMRACGMTADEAELVRRLHGRGGE
ncbi:MAG: DUF2802 domain-containing protein [Gammaproteobacteria bacterium]|nr:DUF2802 domain-containing protein [Gammaproteobacteria bacterium]